MAREDLDDVEYEKTLCVRGYWTQVFWSAIVKVQAHGQRNYLWLIFRRCKFFVGLIFEGVTCPQKLVPHENFIVYGK